MSADFADELRPHRITMFRFAVTLSSRNDAEDIVQDALSRAWTKRAQFDPARGSLRSWLLALVADQARSRWRRPAPLWERTDLDVPAPGGDSDLAVDLRLAVSELPPRQRSAVVLHHFVDLPVTDVAQLLGCSSGTVKSALHDARASLARTLGESYVED